MELYERLSPSNLFSTNGEVLSEPQTTSANLMKMLDLKSESSNDVSDGDNSIMVVPTSLEKKEGVNEQGKVVRSEKDKKQRKGDLSKKKVSDYLHASQKKHTDISAFSIPPAPDPRKLSDSNQFDKARQINYVISSQQQFYRQSAEPEQLKKGRKGEKDRGMTRLHTDRSVTNHNSNKKEQTSELAKTLIKNATTASTTALYSGKKPPTNFQLKNCADKLAISNVVHLGEAKPSVAKQNKSASRQMAVGLLSSQGSLLESEKKGKAKKPLIVKKPSDYLYPPKEGQSNVDQDLKDIQQFVEKWGISVRYKNAYTRSEVAQMLKQVEEKVAALDQVTSYERKKADEYKEEVRLLNDQIDHQREEMLAIQQQMRGLMREFGKESDLIAKLEECQFALKETLLNSLVCIDFYKDLENHIQQSKYEEQEDEVMKHLDIIEQLTKQHGLDSMDFESQKTQQLIDSIGDLIRFKEVQEKVVDVALRKDEEQNLNTWEDEEQSHTHMDSSCLRVKVTKLKKDLSQLRLNQGVGVRTPSQFRSGNSTNTPHGQSSSVAPRIPNRHVYCCQGDHENLQYKQEVVQKNRQIVQLKDQLENRVKRILELKAELQRERDQESQKRRYAQFKETITRLEKEYNKAVIKNTKQELHIKTLKEENEQYLQQTIVLRDHLRQSQNETDEFKKILKQQDGFKKLEETVVELSNLLVSKKNQHLSTSQKMQLKAVFGNSSILHQLRRRLQDLEGHYSKQGVLLTQSMRINMEFQQEFEEIWPQIKLAQEAFKEVEEKDLHHYQLIMVGKAIRQRWGEEQVDKQEGELRERAEQLKEIKSQLSKDTFVEKMSRELAADKDKLALMKMMIQEGTKKEKERGTEGELSMFTPNKALEQMEHAMPKNFSERQSFKFKQLSKVASEKNFGFQNQFLSNESMAIPEFGQNQVEKIDEKLKQLFEGTKELAPSMSSAALQEGKESKREKGQRYQSQDSTPILNLYGAGGQANFDSVNITLQDEGSTMNKQCEQAMTSNLSHPHKSFMKMKFGQKGAEGVSRLDSTNLLNDLDSQNQSVVRATGKKLLKQKIRMYKQEILNLKLTLKLMQERIDRAHIEIDNSATHYSSMHRNQPSGHGLERVGLTGSLSLEGQVSQEEALNIILAQAQGIEALIGGEDLASNF